MSSIIVETQFLVVGAGPAGAGLASFLGQNGLKGIVIAAASGTADTQRAHLNNPFAMECLRDLGVEDEAMRLGEAGSIVQSHRWIRSMVGTEYGRVLCWGGHPDNMRDIATATPCRYLDLPQPLLEPILVKYASLHGFPIRFNTKLIAAEREPSTGFIVCSIEDLMTGGTYTIRTRFLFGADGGRSQVARSFGFTYLRKPSQGTAINVDFHADLGHLMMGDTRGAQLHWFARPDTRSKKFGVAPLIRSLKPWTDWVLSIVSPGSADHGADTLRTDDPELIEYIKELIGDDSVDVQVSGISGWFVRENIAEKYSDDGRNVFILGDAAHQHPPSYGLGSNTCIQDAYNLGWKVALVARGLAGPALLDTFSVERQPVGATLVAEAGDCLRDQMAVSEALGMMAATGEEGARQVAELYLPTSKGAARREKLSRTLEAKKREGHSIGLAMNHFYISSAVYLVDEEKEGQSRPEIVGDPVTTMQISTYPGSRLPHAWLDIPDRRREYSTLDLAGQGYFALFYGTGGEEWAVAAANIAERTGIPIKAHGIGFGLQHYDVYRTWHDIRGVDEDGCVLVRPDRFVAWRSKGIISECEEKLSHVLDKVLSRDGL